MFIVEMIASKKELLSASNALRYDNVITHACTKMFIEEIIALQKRFASVASSSHAKKNL